MNIQLKNIYCRNLNTAFLEALPKDRPLGIIFFIHGCPDDAHVWENLMKKFSGEGYISLAPFLRGIDKSEKPVQKDNARYSPSSLTLDHLEVLSQFDASLPVTVVCHDLGSLSGWELARRLGKRLKRLVAINSPDSITLIKQMRKSSQIKKSWYIGFFQTGRLADLVVDKLRKPMMEKTLKMGSYPHLGEEEVTKAADRFPHFMPHYRQAFGQFPLKILKRMIHHKDNLIESPLILWGDKDPFLNVPTARDLSSVAINPEIRVLEGGHWLPLERESDVFRLIMKGQS